MNYKYRHLFIILLLIVQLITIPLQLSASADKIDSLKEVIRNGKEDAQTVDALILLARTYNIAYKPDSASVYVEKALPLAIRLNYTVAIADCHYIRSLILFENDNYQDAIMADKICIELAKQIKDESRLGKAYYQLGAIFKGLGKLDSALYYLNESMVFNLKLKDTTRLIAMSNLIGSIFQNLSEYDSAVYYYMRAVKLAELSGNQQFLGILYNNVGNIFMKLKDIDEARKYITASLGINQQNGDRSEVARNLINLGICYVVNFEYDSAIASYDKARELVNQMDESTSMGDLFNDYAWAYEKLGRYDSAISYYDKALEVYRRKGYAEGIMVALSNKGSVSIKLGNYKQAELFLDSSLAMANETGYRNNRVMVYGKLAENYYKSGNYQKAYEYYVLKSDLNDSLFDLDKTKIINDLKQKYEKEQDQARILSLEKISLQRTIQRNLIFTGGLFVLIIAISGFIYFRQRIIKARILARQKLLQFEEEKKMMSVRLLVEGQEEERKRVAMELHDGLGVLLSATKMQFAAVKDHNPENLPLINKASQLLEQASKEARRISHNMMPGLLTKLGFFEAVDDMIENINEMDSIEAVCEIEGEQIRLPEKQEIMLYRIIQELTNNTLKYAKARKIELKLDISPSVLVMNYKDDGIGFDMQEVSSSTSTSLGLRSIELRVGFLQGEMKVDSSPGNGVAYTIRVPVEESLVVSR